MKLCSRLAAGATLLLARNTGASAAVARGGARCVMSASHANAALVEPSGAHTASVIFLHGLGDSGDGWASLMPEMDPLLAASPTVRYILPHAPTRPITLNGGMAMPGWFDILGLSSDASEDAAGLSAAAERVEAIMAAEVAAGIPPERIVLAGFSQGGALALHVALRTSLSLAGCVALSSWLPLRAEYPGALAASAPALKFMMGHGDADQVVPLAWGQASHKALTSLGLDARFVTAPGLGHGADPLILREMGAFVNSVLPPSAE